MAEGIITLGIGSAPGSVKWFILFGLNPAAVAVASPGTVTLSDAARDSLTLTDAGVGSLILSDAGVGSLVLSDA